MVSYESDTYNVFMNAQIDLGSSMHLLQEPTQIERLDVVTNDIEVFFECSPGIRHGLYTRYNINGTNIYSCKYVYGRRHGLSVEYYNNGKIKVKCNFNNGRLDGIVNLYNLDGSIIKIFNFTNGLCI